MKKRRFFINALIITANSILLSVLATVFRVYQTRIVGAEGMGLMQLLLSVYFIATNIAASGLNLAVTRLVSEARARDESISVTKILKRCVTLGVSLGILACVLLLIFAKPIGVLWLGDARTVQSLRVLAIGLPFFSVSCCVRGYFLAVRKSLATSLGQIAEQICGFAVIPFLLPRMAQYGLAMACCAISIGMTVGEITGSIFISACCITEMKNEKRYGKNKKGDAPKMKEIFSISAPIAMQCPYFHIQPQTYAPCRRKSIEHL